MAIIGSFTKEQAGYSGTIETLTCVASVRIVPVKKPSAQAPDYRLYRGQSEVGAAWTKAAKHGRTFLVVTLDDPAFPEPVQSRLVASNEGYTLIWSRD